MVDFPGLARLQDDAQPGSLGLPHQVVMHGAARQQRTDRHPLGSHLAVRQDDQAETRVNRLLRFPADPVQHGGESGRTLAARET